MGLLVGIVVALFYYITQTVFRVITTTPTERASRLTQVMSLRKLQANPSTPRLRTRYQGYSLRGDNERTGSAIVVLIGARLHFHKPNEFLIHTTAKKN